MYRKYVLYHKYYRYYLSKSNPDVEEPRLCKPPPCLNSGKLTRVLVRPRPDLRASIARFGSGFCFQFTFLWCKKGSLLLRCSVGRTLQNSKIILSWTEFCRSASFLCTDLSNKQFFQDIFFYNINIEYYYEY